MPQAWGFPITFLYHFAFSAFLFIVQYVIFLIPDSASWDPHSNHYANEEVAFLDIDGLIIQKPKKKKKRIVKNYYSNDKMKIDSCKVDSQKMPSVKEIGEAIDASINSVIANSPEYINYSKSCAENDSKIFADKLKAIEGKSRIWKPISTDGYTTSSQDSDGKLLKM